MLKTGDKKVNSMLRLVENHLKEFGHIDRAEAVELYGCYNLGGIIHDLRTEGLEIKSSKKRGKNFVGYTLVAKKEEPKPVIVVEEPREYWAIIGFYKTTSGAISFRLDQTLFPSEEDADEYGAIAKANDPEMYAYDVMPMVRFTKGE